MVSGAALSWPGNRYGAALEIHSIGCRPRNGAPARVFWPVLNLPVSPTCFTWARPLGVCSSGSVPRTLAGRLWYLLSPGMG
jgi:hypothetical protein